MTMQDSSADVTIHKKVFQLCNIATLGQLNCRYILPVQVQKLRDAATEKHTDL
jgi:hypothetical protein